MNLLPLIFPPLVRPGRGFARGTQRSLLRLARSGTAALVLAAALTGCVEGADTGTDDLPSPVGGYVPPSGTDGPSPYPPTGGGAEPGTTPPAWNDGSGGGTGIDAGDMAGPAGGDIGSILCALIGGCGDAGVLPPVEGGDVVTGDPNDTVVPGREPDPANPKECPQHAPENPIGSCIGVPVYAVCSYTTYNCICDWIHWICI